MLYAEDIVVLSESQIAMQRALNKLYEIQKWKLEVNLAKTKMMVFSKGTKLNKKEIWTYNNKAIEIVEEFKYLGPISPD